MILQVLNNRSCTESREVPVVADILHLGTCSAYWYVIGITLYEHIVILVVCDDLSNLAQCFLSTAVHLIATTLIEHIVSQRNVNYTLQNLNINLLHLFLAQRAGQVVGKNHVERIALAFYLNQVADILVTLVDLVNEFLNAHVVLACIVQTLVKRVLQLSVIALCSSELLLGSSQTSLCSCQFFLGSLIVA